MMKSSRYIPQTEVPPEQTMASLRKLLREAHGRERRLRETLEWYADEARYARIYRAADRHGEYLAGDVMFDQGERAREALAHLEKLQQDEIKISDRELVQKMCRAWDDELTRNAHAAGGIINPDLEHEAAMWAALRVAEVRFRETMNREWNFYNKRLADINAALGRALDKCVVLENAMQDRPRCSVCGWPLMDSPEDGCVPGNCSQRAK